MQHELADVVFPERILHKLKLDSLRTTAAWGNLVRANRLGPRPPQRAPSIHERHKPHLQGPPDALCLDLSIRFTLHHHASALVRNLNEDVCLQLRKSSIDGVGLIVGEGASNLVEAGADPLVRAYHRTFGLPTLITNCSNNYGPFQFPEKVIPLMILNALEARDLPIYGDGQNVRDWIYVADHCRGVLSVLEKGRVGQGYNIGAGNERSNLDLIDILCEELEARRPARENPAMRQRGLSSYAELKTFVPDRPGHDRRYAVDSTKIQGELGWRPAYDLARGLGETVDWYLDHPEWCEAVQSGTYRRERLGTTNRGERA